MSEKKYVGIGRQKRAPFGDYVCLSMSAKDLDLCTASLNATGWVQINIMPRREPKGNQTHYGVIDEYVPKQRDGEPERVQAPVQETGDDGNLPF